MTVHPQGYVILCLPPAGLLGTLGAVVVDGVEYEFEYVRDG